MKNKETRYLPFEGWEVREEADSPPILRGYASVFDTEAEIYGLWREKVAPGTYKKTIAEHDIRAVWNHNTDLVLGRNKAKTLRLGEDKKGLWVEIIPPDTQAGRDAVTSIKRGDVSQMSLAFSIIKYEWTEKDKKDELPLLTIREAKLYEVSPVTFPAFEQTSISARGLAADDPTEQAIKLIALGARGFPLSNDQRRAISAVIEPLTREPEASVVDAHHSEQTSEPEAVPQAHHSEDWNEAAIERERRLAAIEQSLYVQGDNNGYRYTQNRRIAPAPG